MKEKVKGNPRRRLYYLLALLVFLLGGYFSLPFAQTAFVNWWEDDPFTPRCDIPEYMLSVVYRGADSSILYTISPDTQEDTLPSRYFYWDSNISPNGRWIVYSQYSESPVIDLISGDVLYSVSQRSNTSIYWLPDSRLLYQASQSSHWQIYDIDNQRLETLPQTINENSSPRSFRALSGNNYFLASESFDEMDSHKAELVVYDQQLNRRVLHSSQTTGRDSAAFYGSLSPNGRFYVYNFVINHQNNLPNFHQIWLIDLEQEQAQPILIEENLSANFVWSPDSSYFAYSLYEDNILHFYDTQEQELGYSYQSSVQRIEMLEWNNDGFWVQETNTNTGEYKEIISWGRFDGSSIDLNFVIEGDLTGIRELRNSDNLIMTVSSSRIIAQRKSNLLILSPSGEILVNIPDSFGSFFAAESPDNRYLAYTRRNDWIYILDFETKESCKAVSIAEYSQAAYGWYEIPQS